MKASDKKETVTPPARKQDSNSIHAPQIRVDRGNRFVKKGASKECFYFQVARKLIGDKWSLLILFTLRDGSLRFNALLRGVEGISQKVLARALRELERDGYIKRDVINTSPPCVAYSLTTMGRDFLHMLATVAEWVETNWQTIEDSRGVFDSRTERLGPSILERPDLACTQT